MTLTSWWPHVAHPPRTNVSKFHENPSNNECLRALLTIVDRHARQSEGGGSQYLKQILFELIIFLTEIIKNVHYQKQALVVEDSVNVETLSFIITKVTKYLQFH